MAVRRNKSKKRSAGSGQSPWLPEEFVHYLEETYSTRKRSLPLLCGMLAEFFLPGLGRLDFPDGFHLLAAIGFLHEFVVEGVAGIFVAGRPHEGFGPVGGISAGV